jgi:TolA-binding protein
MEKVHAFFAAKDRGVPPPVAATWRPATGGRLESASPLPAAEAVSPPSTIPVAPATLPRTPAPAASVQARRVVAAAVTSVAPTPRASVAAASDVPQAVAAEAASEEEDVYTRAHRLHFDGADPAAALAAWDDYLLRFPDGRFAPDARYNRAIDLVRLRRYVEARAALQPFADGSFGGYHRDAARELLRSIP